MDIKITVIIPVYNVEKYLAQCLDSVARQTIPFDEVILINDGSTDHSLAICREYISKYRYFKLINQENQGLATTRNRGIKFTSGEYIMFLDSDDYLRLDAVKVLKEKLLEFSYDAIFYDADIIHEEGVCFPKRNFYDRRDADLDGIQLSGGEYFARCYPQYYVASACMAVYKKKTIISADIKFPEGLYFEDNYFSLMFICQATCVTHISEKLYQRRYRENSITTSVYSERKFIDYIKCFMLSADGICQMERCVLVKLKKKFLEFISNWCNNCFDIYCVCIEQGIVFSENVVCYFHCIQEKYFKVLDKLCFNASLLDLVVLNKILKCLYSMWVYEFENKKYIEKKINEIVEVEKKLYMDILKKLSLDKVCKVGIYGTGKHTEGLLDIFERLGGRIICDLVFLDSQKDNEWYKGRRIINYQKITDENLDLIIISSFIYEKQMLRNIRSINVDIPIHMFYHTLKEDVFSGYELFLACLEKRVL